MGKKGYKGKSYYELHKNFLLLNRDKIDGKKVKDVVRYLQEKLEVCDRMARIIIKKWEKWGFIEVVPRTVKVKVMKE